MNYGTAPTPTGFGYDTAEAYQHPVSSPLQESLPKVDRCGGTQIPQGFYSLTHFSTNTNLVDPFAAASSPADSIGSETSPGGLQIPDGESTPTMAYKQAFAAGVVLGQQCQWVPNLVSRKRRGPPDEDTEADPFGWGFESGRPGVLNQGDLRNKNKRLKTTDSEETGVGPFAQWGESQELPFRRTPVLVNRKSKLGHGLNNMETLVAPLQGVSLPLAPGPSITGATLGTNEYVFQAWTEGEDESVSGETTGIEDAHDEEETDGERWRRLMRCENGTWICVGCGGKPFFDRSTLQRHCKSSVHSKARDFRECLFCTKGYVRSSNLRRHVRVKHPEEWEKMRG